MQATTMQPLLLEQLATTIKEKLEIDSSEATPVQYVTVGQGRGARGFREGTHWQAYTIREKQVAVTNRVDVDKGESKLVRQANETRLEKRDDIFFMTQPFPI